MNSLNKCVIKRLSGDAQLKRFKKNWELKQINPANQSNGKREKRVSENKLFKKPLKCEE